MRSCSSVASYAHTAHRTSFKLIPGVLVLLSLSPSTIVCVYLGPANLYSIILMIITVIIISFHFIYSFKFYIIFNLHQHISHTHIWARTFCASYFSFPLLPSATYAALLLALLKRIWWCKSANQNQNQQRVNIRIIMYVFVVFLITKIYSVWIPCGHK